MSDTERITFPKNKVYKLAQELGATVAWDEVSWFEVRVDAPDGKHWACSVVHQLVAATRRNPTSKEREECWVDILERMQMGLEACEPDTNQDCADNAMEAES